MSFFRKVQKLFGVGKKTTVVKSAQVFQFQPKLLAKLEVPLTMPVDVSGFEIGIEAGHQWLGLGVKEIFGREGGFQTVSFTGAIAIFYPTGIGLAVQSNADLQELENWLHADVWPKYRQWRAT